VGSGETVAVAVVEAVTVTVVVADGVGVRGEGDGVGALGEAVVVAEGVADGVRNGVAVRVGVPGVAVEPGRTIVTVCCATLLLSESSVMRSKGSIVTRSV
jgi:hypothetical protein